MPLGRPGSVESKPAPWKTSRVRHPTPRLYEQFGGLRSCSRNTRTARETDLKIVRLYVLPTLFWRLSLPGLPAYLWGTDLIGYGVAGALERSPHVPAGYGAVGAPLLAEG